MRQNTFCPVPEKILLPDRTHSVGDLGTVAGGFGGVSSGFRGSLGFVGWEGSGEDAHSRSGRAEKLFANVL